VEAVAHGEPAVPDEQRVLLNGVPWGIYVVLRDTLDSSGVKLTYLEGQLEITSPSRRHEVEKKLLARLLELFALEKNVPLFAYGSTTFRQEVKERGLEPDECYCRGTDKDIPELAIEVMVSRPLLDKLKVYSGLGIAEVWTFRSGKIQVHLLRGDAYEPARSSPLFPELDLELLASFATRLDQDVALREFRDRIRGH
jgi:Uma2 family endonuclease